MGVSEYKHFLNGRRSEYLKQRQESNIKSKKLFLKTNEIGREGKRGRNLYLDIGKFLVK